VLYGLSQPGAPSPGWITQPRVHRLPTASLRVPICSRCQEKPVCWGSWRPPSGSGLLDGPTELDKAVVLTTVVCWGLSERQHTQAGGAAEGEAGYRLSKEPNVT